MPTTTTESDTATATQARFSVFKKIASVGRKRKGSGMDAADANNPYGRAHRSMDGRPKPFISQPVLGLPSGRGDGAPSSVNSSDTDVPSSPRGSSFRIAISRSSFSFGRTRSRDERITPSVSAPRLRPSATTPKPATNHRTEGTSSASSKHTNGSANTMQSSPDVHGQSPIPAAPAIPNGKPAQPPPPPVAYSRSSPGSRQSNQGSRGGAAPRIPSLLVSEGLGIDHELKTFTNASIDDSPRPVTNDVIAPASPPSVPAPSIVSTPASPSTPTASPVARQVKLALPDKSTPSSSDSTPTPRPLNNQRPPSILLNKNQTPIPDPFSIPGQGSHNLEPSVHSMIETVPRQSSVPQTLTQSQTLPSHIRRAGAPSFTLPSPRPLPASGSFSRLTLNELTGGARLSPSITIRQPLMPILTLPPLPPTTQAEAAPPRPQNAARLRSMPRLSLAGSSGVREEEEEDDSADHGNAALDSDEEDMEHDDSDSGTTEGAESGRQRERESRGLRTPRLDLGALKPTRVLSGLGAATPKPGKMMDYFSSPKQPQEQRQQQGSSQGRERKRSAASESPSTTPRQADVPLPPEPERQLSDSPSSLRSPALPLPTSPRLGADSNRPSLTHHASKSMVDLLSPGRQRGTIFDDPQASTSTAAASQSPHATLKRRGSMPTFTNPSAPPPPYPAFAPFPVKMRRGFTGIQPRDDEGAEKLPPYTNSLHLVGLMPRKLEFESAGVQARDRKWRRVVCELEGTVFRIYEPPPSGNTVKRVGQWWEKKVGVGDSTIVAPLSTAVRSQSQGTQAQAQTELVRDPKANDDSANASQSPVTVQESPQQQQEAGSRMRSSRSLASTLLHPSRAASPGSRSSIDIPGDGSRQGRSSFSAARSTSGSSSGYISGSASSGHVTSATSRTSMSSMGDSRSRISTTSPPANSPTSPTGSTMASSQSRLDLATEKSQAIPIPDRKYLIREYTMQHAESGLGSDYVKRKNVIRVRMEGEQFLLQAPDVSGVVDWIEGFQAAQNIALDIDERPMPKGPLFPRRRRRRARRPEDQARTQNSSGADNAGASERARAERDENGIPVAQPSHAAR